MQYGNSNEVCTFYVVVSSIKNLYSCVVIAVTLIRHVEVKKRFTVYVNSKTINLQL